MLMDWNVYISLRWASLIRHLIRHSKPKCNFSLINKNIHASLSLCKQTSCWGMRNWKMSFSGKHDPQDSRNYIHYFNCLKEQFIAHCWCLQQLQCMESVIASLYFLFSGRKSFFKTSVFLVDYSKLVYQLPMNYLKLQSQLFN